MKKLLIGTLLGLSTVSAFADEEVSTEASTDESTYSDTGYFSGKITGELLLGNTSQDAFDVDGSDTSFGLRGTYNINSNVGIELSYHNYGEADWSFIDSFGDTITGSYASDSVNLGVKGTLPLKKGFSLNARLGIAFWNTDLEYNDSSISDTTFKGADSGNDIYYGIGAQYSINEKFNIGVEYSVATFSFAPDDDFEGIDDDLEIKTFALTAGMKF